MIWLLLAIAYVAGTAALLVNVWRWAGDEAQPTDYLWLSVWPLIVLGAIVRKVGGLF